MEIRLGLLLVTMACTAGAAQGAQEVMVAGVTYLVPCTASTSGNCYIDLKVVPQASGCEIQWIDSSQEIVGIKGANFVLWRIVDPPKGWIFTTDGVVIADNTQRDFANPKIVSSGLGYRWRNWHRVHRTYKYAVTVTDEATEAIECTLDPWIKNQ
jgi:hypothetical protein